MRLILLFVTCVMFLCIVKGSARAQDGLFDAVTVFRDGGGARVCDADLGSDGLPADHWELVNSLYVPYGDVGSGRVIYILSAPWCPFCRRVLREDASFLRGIELRLVIGGLANGSDMPRFYRLATSGSNAVPQMFTGLPRPLTGVPTDRRKRIVDAMLLNAHVLEMRYSAIYGYLQRIGEARPGPFGYPTYIVPRGTGAMATATPILSSINLDAIRRDGPYRMPGVPANEHWFVRNPPVISPIERGAYTWENGVRVQAFPNTSAPGFCYDGRTSLFVSGALRTDEGLWAYVEALDLALVSGAGSGYVAHGYALIED